MPGLSLNTITSTLTPNATAANQNTANQIGALKNDIGALEVSDLQGATAESRIATDLAATMTQLFTKKTSDIIDKLA